MSDTQQTNAADHPRPGSEQTTAVEAAQQQAGGSALGPFTHRDLVVIAAVVVIFIGTLIPALRPGIGNFWASAGLFFLGIGILLPLVVLVLFVIRRVNPAGKITVGTLSVDQFGSVVASFATAFFFLQTVTGVGSGVLIGSVISLIGALALLVATVLARWIPFFGLDRGTGATTSAVSVDPSVDLVGSTFVEAPAPLSEQVPTAAEQSSAEATAAEPEAPETQNPETQIAETAAPAPQTPEVPLTEAQPTESADPEAADSPETEEPSSSFQPEAGEQQAGEQQTSQPEVRQPESFAATVDPAERPNQNTAGEIIQEAFWFAVDQPRAVVDERTGGFLYNIEPGNWFLALQDRGYEYLVQSPEGKVGLLRDLRNIERAPQDD